MARALPSPRRPAEPGSSLLAPAQPPAAGPAHDSCWGAKKCLAPQSPCSLRPSLQRLGLRMILLGGPRNAWPPSPLLAPAQPPAAGPAHDSCWGAKKCLAPQSPCSLRPSLQRLGLRMILLGGQEMPGPPVPLLAPAQPPAAGPALAGVIPGCVIYSLRARPRPRRAQPARARGGGPGRVAPRGAGLGARGTQPPQPAGRGRPGLPRGRGAPLRRGAEPGRRRAGRARRRRWAGARRAGWWRPPPTGRGATARLDAAHPVRRGGRDVRRRRAPDIVLFRDAFDADGRPGHW